MRNSIFILFSIFLLSCSSTNSPTKISKFAGTYQGAVVTTRALSGIGTAVVTVNSDGGISGEIKIQDQGTTETIDVESDPVFINEITEDSYSIKLSNYTLVLYFIDSGSSVKIECFSSTRTITGTLTKK